MKKIVIIKKDCVNWKGLWLKKIHACNKINFSSNINEVNKAVLNFFFFYEKILHAQKAPKNTKSTKTHKDTQATAQNANRRISDYFPLRCFLGAIFIFIGLQAFCAFCASEFFE